MSLGSSEGVFSPQRAVGDENLAKGSFFMSLACLDVVFLGSPYGVTTWGLNVVYFRMSYTSWINRELHEYFPRGLDRLGS
jgi:hypothetical protein